MKKTALTITVATAAALLLAGCTPALPHAASTPAPAPASSTPTAGPNSTSAGTAAPVAQATNPPASAPGPETTNEPNPWVITEDGVGPFRVGDDDEAELIAAGFTTPSAEAGSCIQLYSLTSGDPRETHQQEFDTTVGVQNHHIVYTFVTADSPDGHLYADPRAPRTDTGITFGTTFDDVKATFPDIKKDVDYGGYREYVIGVDRHYLRVTTTGSLEPVEVVTGLRAASFPTWQVPGC